MISIIDFVNAYTLLLVCIGILTWYYSKLTFAYWKKLNIKHKKPAPLFGNVAKILLMRQSYHEMIDEFYRYFGNEPFGGYYMLAFPELMVKDPEFITRVLKTDFKSFTDHSFADMVCMDKELNPLFSNLFFANGYRWKILRQRLSPMFTSGKLKLMYEQMFDCVSFMNEFLMADMRDEGTDVNMKELFEKVIIDVIGSCAFGLECNSLNSNQKFREKCLQVYKGRRWVGVRLFFLFLFGSKIVKFFNMPEMKKDVSEFFINLVLDTLIYREENAVSRNDFLQMLKELQNTCVDPKYAFYKEKNAKILLGEGFDEIDIAANAFNFLTAGFSTTASALAFCVYELSLNTQIQDRVRLEVQQVQAKHEKIDAYNLKELSYMDSVISETLRKYPPFLALNRKCMEDYQIPNTNVTLPAGTKIVIPVWSIQHDSKYYPNPEVFDPERFNSTNRAKIVNGTYVPFGDGPRQCIGKRFTEMEMKAILADMILNYEFAPCTKTEIPLVYKKKTFTLETKSGIWINISKRKI